MGKYIINDTTLTGIADAIRGKTGGTEPIALLDMAGQIEGIESGTSGKPIEIDTLDNALLTAENDGKVYKCDDKLYQVNKITSLKGLTIKFNEHITPCPVIGEDDVFECSGVIMGFEHFASEVTYNPPITAIKKVTYTSVSGTGIIAFVVVDYEELHYISADNQEESGWYVFEINGNEMPTYAPAAIYNFDCPALNENPEFIEWVLANAKVYHKIECLNDIKCFKLNLKEADDFFNLHWVCDTALFEEGVDYSMENGISGQYTASFLSNGELVTKTFSTLFLAWEAPQYRFTNNNNESLVFEQVDGGEVVIKYNDVVLEEEPIFTTFDCGLNDSYYFLSYILTYSELIDMEYINGCEFVEYLVPLYQEKTITENGEVLPDEGYDGLSKVVVDVSGEVVEEYDGTITIV